MRTLLSHTRRRMLCHWCRVELVTLPLTSAMDDLRATATLQSASEHAAGYAQ